MSQSQAQTVTADKRQPLRKKDANVQTLVPGCSVGKDKQRGTKRKSSALACTNDKKTKTARRTSTTSTLPLSCPMVFWRAKTRKRPLSSTPATTCAERCSVPSRSTYANLARQFDALLPKSSVKATQLRKFLGFDGVQGGAHSPIFYAGYGYFEKIRVK
ncbi:hypothetical protein LTS10_010469 [Elasticomyces elasticus]|nr:hypothetical protein LTS10_010469 [Elasticomyces elasticus]